MRNLLRNLERSWERRNKNRCHGRGDAGRPCLQRRADAAPLSPRPPPAASFSLFRNCVNQGKNTFLGAAASPPNESVDTSQDRHKQPVVTTFFLSPVRIYFAPRYASGRRRRVQRQLQPTPHGNIPEIIAVHVTQT